MKKSKYAFVLTFLCAISICLGIFAACSKDALQYEERGDNFYAVSATSTDISGDIEIPSEYNGKKVVLKEFAFEGCKNLKKVTLSAGFTSIGQYCFKGCSTVVVIPVSVTSFSEESFKDTSMYRIEYGGTKEQWTQIKNCTFVPSTIHIICTDGEFTK